MDWNDQKYAEVCRHSWETITNRYLEAAGRPERVDLRSFERQGIQQIPTVHLGPAAYLSLIHIYLMNRPDVVSIVNSCDAG